MDFYRFIKHLRLRISSLSAVPINNKKIHHIYTSDVKVPDFKMNDGVITISENNSECAENKKLNNKDKETFD